jgi:hypothetical protein
VAHPHPLVGLLKHDNICLKPVDHLQRAFSLIANKNVA